MKHLKPGWSWGLAFGTKVALTPEVFLSACTGPVRADGA